MLWTSICCPSFEKNLTCMLVGIKDVKQVSLGIQHILADIIAKDSSTLSSVKEM